MNQECSHDSEVYCSKRQGGGLTSLATDSSSFSVTVGVLKPYHPIISQRLLLQRI